MFKDVLNHSDLSLYAQVGLVIFFGVFVVIVLRTLTRSRREIERCARIPLSDTVVDAREVEVRT